MPPPHFPRVPPVMENLHSQNQIPNAGLVWAHIMGKSVVYE